MKLHILLTLIVIVGLWSCADEQPTQQIPTAEKASLKTNLDEVEETAASTISEEEKELLVTENISRSENDEPTEIRGAQNFDPNSDNTFYDKKASKDATPVKKRSSDDVDVEVNASKGGIPQISFDEKRHYFGTIEEGEQVTHTFKFVNTGTGDLIISNATASCGCTKPSFSFLPIKPNESNSIEVTFNSAGRDGMQSKAITITTNAYPRVRKVFLEGKIVPKGTKDGDKLQADPDQE